MADLDSMHSQNNQLQTQLDGEMQTLQQHRQIDVDQIIRDNSKDGRSIPGSLGIDDLSDTDKRILKTLQPKQLPHPLSLLPLPQQLV